MKFIGRKEELKKLNKVISSEEMSFALIYGRRRVGKSELVNQAIAKSKAISIVGGGDSAAAIKESGYSKLITHISTGGGATLEYLEGKPLPAINMLLDKE